MKHKILTMVIFFVVPCCLFAKTTLIQHFTKTGDHLNWVTARFLLITGNPAITEDEIKTKYSTFNNNQNNYDKFIKGIPDSLKKNKEIANAIESEKKKLRDDVNENNFAEKIDKLIEFCLKQIPDNRDDNQKKDLKTQLEEVKNSALKDELVSPPKEPKVNEIEKLKTEISTLRSQIGKLTDLEQQITKQNEVIKELEKKITNGGNKGGILGLTITALISIVLSLFCNRWIPKKNKKERTNENSQKNNPPDISHLLKEIEKEIEKKLQSKKFVTQTDLKSLQQQITTLQHQINEIKKLLQKDNDDQEKRKGKGKSESQQRGNDENQYDLYYLEMPNPQGIFEDSKRTTQPNTETFYVIAIFKNDPTKAKFQFIDDARTQKIALQDYDIIVKPVCIVDNSTNNGKSIKNMKDGFLKLEGDKWVLDGNNGKCHIEILT
jgi:hypothetical protein